MIFWFLSPVRPMILHTIIGKSEIQSTLLSCSTTLALYQCSFQNLITTVTFNKIKIYFREQSWYTVILIDLNLISP